MKTLVLSVIIAGMLIAAGCTGTAPASTPPAQVTTSGTAEPGTPLPMQAHTTIGSGNTAIAVYIDEIKVEAKEADGTRPVTIYIAARNNGTAPVRLVWFCRLTDTAGNTYGGINISHGGNGARTSWIQPNRTEAARDYVTLTSGQELAILSNGAVLDVYFMEKPSDDVPVSLVPDYHAAWKIDPGVII